MRGVDFFKGRRQAKIHLDWYCLQYLMSVVCDNYDSALNAEIWSTMSNYVSFYGTKIIIGDKVLNNAHANTDMHTMLNDS